MKKWLRIHLPIQGTWVWSSVRGASTPHRAVKSALHTTELRAPQSLRSEAIETAAVRSPRKATREEPCSAQLEKAGKQQWRHSTAKNKIKKQKNFPKKCGSKKLHCVLQNKHYSSTLSEKKKDNPPCTFHPLMTIHWQLPVKRIHPLKIVQKQEVYDDN